MIHANDTKNLDEPSHDETLTFVCKHPSRFADQIHGLLGDWMAFIFCSFLRMLCRLGVVSVKAKIPSIEPQNDPSFTLLFGSHAGPFDTCLSLDKT